MKSFVKFTAYAPEDRDRNQEYYENVSNIKRFTVMNGVAEDKDENGVVTGRTKVRYATIVLNDMVTTERQKKGSTGVPLVDKKNNPIIEVVKDNQTLIISEQEEIDFLVKQFAELL
jgi:hypothetical protein